MKFTLALLVALLLPAPSALAAARLPFTSSFETGDFSEWQGGRDATLTVSSLSASAGTRAARAVMTLGQPTDNYKDYYFGDHPTVNGEPVTDIGLWLRFDSQFEQGFVFGSGLTHKIALINFCDANGRRRYQILINVWIPTGRYFIEHLRWNADGSFSTSFAGLSQNVGTPVLARLGEWDRLKLYIRPNTPGSANGIVRLWVNGQLKTEYTNVPMREATTFNPNKLILSNYVTSTQTAGVQWWDNFYLGETDPDVAQYNPAPSAPRLHP
jgi:hypothetical protein